MFDSIRYGWTSCSVVRQSFLFAGLTSALYIGGCVEHEHYREREVHGIRGAASAGRGRC